MGVLYEIKGEMHRDAYDVMQIDVWYSYSRNWSNLIYKFEQAKMNMNNYHQYAYTNQQYNPNIPTSQPPLHKNIMYGGSTILRNGSNSYRPLPVADNPALSDRKLPKFKPLQRTLEPT